MDNLVQQDDGRTLSDQYIQKEAIVQHDDGRAPSDQDIRKDNSLNASWRHKKSQGLQKLERIGHKATVLVEA